MMRRLVRTLRLYAVQSWFSFKALSGWYTPFNYFSHKFGFPFFTMLLFLFMGRYLGLANPIYIVIGNILLMPASNCIYGISLIVSNEKQFGALTYLLGSPASRAPIFLGRGLFHILDGFAGVAIALPAALLLFKVDLEIGHLLLALFCIMVVSITTSGVGFLLGGVSLVSRDGWMITSTLALALYILVGVNFPVDLLPGFLRALSYGLPMTRGILAARLALDGAGWAGVAPLIYGEMVVGLIYLVVGYALFRLIERRSMETGMLDAL